MTVERLNAKYSRCTPDTGMTLMMGDDERQYSVITCLTKKVPLIREVAVEAE